MRKALIVGTCRTIYAELVVRPDVVRSYAAPERVRLVMVQWHRWGAGPRLALDQARELARNPALEVFASFASNSELAGEWSSLGLPSFSVRTHEGRLGLVLGIPRLVIASFAFRRFLRRNRIEVVFSSMNSVWQSIGLSIYLPRGTKLVASAHDVQEHLGNRHWLRSWSVRRELSRANAVVTYSRAVTNGIRPRLRSDQVLHQSHLGVRITDREPRQLGERDHVIGVFGLVVAYKGMGLFLEALRIARGRGVGVRGFVAGAGDVDSEVIDSSADYVDWDLRWIPEDEVDSVLARFDVLALPYLEGSQSASLTAGLSVGLPVVATPVGGLPEQVEISGAGLLAEEVSAQAFADAVEKMVGDPVRYSEFSACALASARNELSWERAADGLHDLVLNLARAT